MRETWPLYECISARSLVELGQYQWLNYHERLDVFSGSGEYDEQSFIESLAEMDRLMKQRPHPEGAGWRG